MNNKRIYEIIPDVDVLVGFAPEDLAYCLLEVARSNMQHNIVHRNIVISVDPPPGVEHQWNVQERARAENALTEALDWLEKNSILVPAPGVNGDNGYRSLSREGRELADKEKFDSYKRGMAFPKALLHPSIADPVWSRLARGDFADAVLFAYRTVEESVRAAGNYANTDYGTSLMRQAFHSTSGPLADQSQPEAEREAFAHLFAGAIGLYKNPHSHRTVTINDRVEAQEMVMLASHLLRIVDSRT